MNTDFTELSNGDTVFLHPNEQNPIHQVKTKATYLDGYFYCEGTNPMEGPDYYFGDVLKYNHGWTFA